MAKLLVPVAVVAAVFLNVVAAADRQSTDTFETRNRKSPPQKHIVGHEWEMSPAKPLPFCPFYKPAGKLMGRKALITGGDSGIGRAVALHFCLEGADVAIACLDEEMPDALETKRLCEADVATLMKEMIKLAPEATKEFQAEAKTVKKFGKAKMIIVTGDIGSPETVTAIVQNVTSQFGKVDILVNNAGEYHPVKSFSDLTPEQLQRTFATNVFGQFYMAQAVAKQMIKGDTIINTASVAAYKGAESAIEYAASKGAVVGFTRSLSAALVEKGIRVNAVAPGPIFTSLLVSGVESEEQLGQMGESTPMKRMGDTCEMAPSYVFLASFDSNYMTGQTLHPNGGTIING